MNEKELLLSKKLFIFDMDGTIYLGETVFDFAICFINHLREAGKQILFFTNNTSHTVSFYYERLAKRGFSPRDGEIMTAGDVMISYLRRHYAGKRIYLLGTEALREAFCCAGVPVMTEQEAACEDADAVVVGFDTTLSYEKLKYACRMIRRGAAFLATHPDKVCPTEQEPIPDCGAFCACITAATDRAPLYVGKPQSETVEAITHRTGASLDEMCVFGDRLYTDIALGSLNGFCSVLVLTGETSADMAEKVTDAFRPTMVYPSLAEVDGVMFG